MMQRITKTLTRYRMRYCKFFLSLTWLDYNATRYLNFNVLRHALPYISLSLAWFGAICKALPPTRYRQIYKKININIFLKKITVTRRNALQIAQNQVNCR